MVERVARAFAEGIGCNPDGPDLHDEERRPIWRRYIETARVAIAAMREPNEAQYEALSATGKMWRELDSKTVWQTYIDAALSS